MVPKDKLSHPMKLVDASIGGGGPSIVRILEVIELLLVEHQPAI
jgi:hypothetical protein